MQAARGVPTRLAGKARSLAKGGYAPLSMDKALATARTALQYPSDFAMAAQKRSAEHTGLSECDDGGASDSLCLYQSSPVPEGTLETGGLCNFASLGNM